MGLKSKVFTTLVVLYIGVFTFKMLTLLAPTLFMKSADANEPTLVPAWEKGTTIRLTKVELVNEDQKTHKHKVRSVDLGNLNETAFVFTNEEPTDLKSSGIRFSLSTNEYREMMLPKTVIRFQFASTSSNTVLQAQVPIVLYRSVQKSLVASSTRGPKRNLVQGWPVLGNLYPRNRTSQAALQEPAFTVISPRNSTKVAYIVPRIVVQFVADWTLWPLNRPDTIPEHIRPYLRMDYSSSATKKGSQGHKNQYLPILSTIQMGVKQHDLIQINKTSTDDFPAIQVEISTVGISRWAFYALMEESFKVHRSIGIVEETDLDDIRSLLTENPAEVLALTMIISMFHLLFDTLAFQSEISYWRKIKQAEGLSLRSMILGFVSQVIVTLYLQEESASMLVLLPSYAGLLIGLWKLVKLISLRSEHPQARRTDSVDNSLQPPGDASISQTQKDQDEADSTALSYMFILLAPLVIGYSLLTLVRDDHFSWYSWCISSLASTVYAGGFALMTPQIFLNYKLKSVSHLDWPALWYRAFNTFIDDFFAYLIPMPGLARMAVLRDDLIFIIFLYQRWIYPSRKADIDQQDEKQKVE